MAQVRQVVIDELSRMLSEWPGGDHPVGPETNILHLVRHSGAQWVDLDTIPGWIYEHFGVEISYDEWNKLFPVKVKDAAFVGKWEETETCTTTVQELADAISVKLPRVSFDPARMFGTNCGPAGAFLGLLELANHVDPNVGRFPPRARIRSLLRGWNLREFLAQSQILSGVRLRYPQDAFRDTATLAAGCSVIGGLLVIVLILVHAVTGFLDVSIGVALFFLILFLGSGLVAAVLGVVISFRDVFYPALPVGVRTFRDLAIAIADHNKPKSDLPAFLSPKTDNS